MQFNTPRLIKLEDLKIDVNLAQESGVPYITPPPPHLCGCDNKLEAVDGRFCVFFALGGPADPRRFLCDWASDAVEALFSMLVVCSGERL